MLFPIKDDIPTLRTPRITIALIVINALIFIYSQTLGVRGFQLFIFNYGYIPHFFLDGGSQYTLPSWYYMTPLSSMFLHGGWMHLIGNMVFLWIFGNNIEDYFGPIKFIFFYILSGLAAIALYTLFNPSSQIPLVGASGAIAGVMGAYMVLHPHARITCLLFFIFIQFLVLPAKIVLGLWFLYQIIMSLFGSATGGGVAWLAHVGGFIFGWVILKLMLKITGRGTTPSGNQRIYRVKW
ncbi:MAG: rhomboid family intramembrane serine protease [candidate division Zixibacteria bacterium]|nr:rhomboid family intramembrane serine protease [candidate division Zixibacteria bacterium]